MTDAARSAAGPGPSRAAVPILMYHSLDRSGSVVSVDPDVFSTHMRTLARRGFSCIALEQLVEAWDGQAALPDRPIVLTFDDAYRNVLERGVPVLVELGFRATVFVVTDWCGRPSDWPGQGSDIPALPLMDWDDLGRAREASIELGAHTRTHPRLPELGPDETEEQILSSRDALHSRLGADVATFAYPYGLLSPPAHAVAAAHFRAAVSVRHGVARFADDRHALPRLDAYYLRSPSAMRWFGTLPGRTWLGLRGVARTARDVLRRHT